MNVNCNEMDLLELFQTLFPEIQVKQSDLDNPTKEFVSIFYQQFRNKLNLVLSEAVKDIEPDEGKRNDTDAIHSSVRFVNFTTLSVYPSIDSSVTFKLLHVPTGKSFKAHVRPLLKVLRNFELEFAKIKDILFNRFTDSNKLHSKRTQLDSLKRKLASIVSEISADEKINTDLQKNHEKVQGRFKKLRQVQDTKKLTSEKLKEEIKGILEEHDNLQALVTNIKANIQQLNKQIVPEDTFKGLISLKENINVICTDLKNEECAIQENLRGKQIDLERFNKIENHLNELHTFASELSTIHGIHLEGIKKLKRLDKNAHDISDKIQKLNAARTQLLNKIQSRKEAIKNTGNQNLDAAEVFSRGLSEIKQQLAQEKATQDQQLRRKGDLELTQLNLTKSCQDIKHALATAKTSQTLKTQNLLNIENSNTTNLSDALTETYAILSNKQS